MYFCEILLDFGLHASTFIIELISVCGGRLGQSPESGQVTDLGWGEVIGLEGVGVVGCDPKSNISMPVSDFKWLACLRKVSRTDRVPLLVHFSVFLSLI